MWVLLSAQLRRWLIAAVAIPALMFLVRTVRNRIESRSGTTRLSRALRHVENVGNKVNGRNRRLRR